MVKRLSLISERIGCTSRFGLDLDQADTARKMSTWHCDITEHFSFHVSHSPQAKLYTSAAQKESLDIICFRATSEIPRKDS